ncbi:MAG: MFS transporter [Armatimonadetes bacterium]|nr:MFS transporter [Armatimonadota bacterium]
MRDRVAALVLATVSFTVSFAVWGMMAPLARTLQDMFALTESQTWLLIAVPVLLGSVMRLPMGMLADRYGGRLVFGALLLFMTVPAFMLSFATSYAHLVVGGLFLGMAGTSFSIGVAFTSKWFPPEKQGFALGVYGAGNIGQSVALFAVPVLTAWYGFPTTFRLFGLAALIWGIIFLAIARNAPLKAQPKPLREMLRVLVDQPMSWLLSLFYFVTFGGFVAMSIGLPKILQEAFGMSAGEAGLRVAGFVAVATLVRPLGGALSDRIGGAKILFFVFASSGMLALCMTSDHILPFSVGALGVGAVIGLGNGAVFKLVPQYFPKDTGTVTGLVGAMGGLGGFFPPLVLGVIRARTGSYDLGFVLLGFFCFACLALNYYYLMLPRFAREVERGAALRAAVASLLLLTAIFLGSHGLQHFDVALSAYAFATVFACFGLVYRYSVWLEKPPTRMYWKRGWQLFLRPHRLPGNLVMLARLFISNLGLQTFIARRGLQRWVAHLLISWGCIVACLVTFPLVFGWVHFEADPANPIAYQVFVMGLPTGTFPSTSIVGWLTFHVLDFCALAILIAIPLVMGRRIYDRGALGLQRFNMDLLPLVLLIGICVTGLMLTVSAMWLRGHSYSFIALLHAFVVIVTLLYLPFGKFFHIFQRPAQLGVSFYKQAGAEGEQAHCTACRQPFASRLQVEDLKTVLDELGVDQTMASGAHYQDVCPNCRRRALARHQLKAIGGPGFL